MDRKLGRKVGKRSVRPKKEGKLKSIGISTYGVGHMQEMVDAHVPLPAVNQVSVIKSTHQIHSSEPYLLSYR